MTERARELLRLPFEQRRGEVREREVAQRAGDLLQVALAQPLGFERVEQRSLQPLDQVLGAGEVEVEESVEDGRVAAALDQRRPQRGAERRPVLEAHEDG